MAQAAPVFVSDAMPEDVTAHVEWLRTAAPFPGAAAVGEELTAALAPSLHAPALLSLLPHHFLSSPHAFWELPGDLAAVLGSAALVIVKGDGAGGRDGYVTLPPQMQMQHPPSPLFLQRTTGASSATATGHTTLTLGPPLHTRPRHCSPCGRSRQRWPSASRQRQRPGRGPRTGTAGSRRGSLVSCNLGGGQPERLLE